MKFPHARQQRLRSLLLITVATVTWLLSCSAPPLPASTPLPPIKEPPTEQPTIAPILTVPVETPTSARANVPIESAPKQAVPTLVPTPNREIILELPGAVATPAIHKPPAYTAFDFLRGYLTNRTRATIIEGKPWTNSTVNVTQLQEELGGVTYWDFFSEPENWDSPFYMWQRDDGTWQPYEKQRLRDSKGVEATAYLLLERQGPGAMDRLWFTQDAVWMLTTEQSKKDVGPIENMGDFIEWGNLDALGKLRIEVDDRIAYDGGVRDWISGKAWSLTPELASILTWRHREFGSSGTILPVLYQKHLRVWVYGGTKKPKWFLATGIRFPDSVQVKPYTGTQADLPLDEMKRLARNVAQPENFIDTLDALRAFDLTIQPGNASVIRLNGAGTLAAFQFRLAKKYDPRQLWLRIKYGNQIAANLPFIAFFSDQKSLELHRSTPLGVIDVNDAYLFYCNYPMPFQAGLVIELATNSASPIVVSARTAVSRETANTQLWVNYREPEKLRMYGPDYTVELPGNGKLVGIVLVTEDQMLDSIPKVFAPGKSDEDPVKRAWSMGYLEGNLAMTDGVGSHRVFGGQEDWADGGFYFNRGYTEPPGGSNRPFGGLLRYKDAKDGYATIFRYFNDLSEFRFKNGLTLSFGHGTWKNNFPVSYGTTVYYYKETSP